MIDVDREAGKLCPGRDLSLLPRVHLLVRALLIVTMREWSSQLKKAPSSLISIALQYPILSVDIPVSDLRS